MTAPMTPDEARLRELAEPVSNPYRFDAEIGWLREAAWYFSRRPTGGEDSAHWANVYNANNAEKLADRLASMSDALSAERERGDRAVAALEPFAAVAGKFGCWSVVEVCVPDPDNPSPVIHPMPLFCFEDAAAIILATQKAKST